MKSVVIIHREHPLLAGVERLLSAEADLNLFTVSFNDEADIAREILRVQPDTIIVDESLHVVVLNLLLELFRAFPQMHLVVISSWDNQLQVYNKKQVWVNHFDDLISVVRAG